MGLKGLSFAELLRGSGTIQDNADDRANIDAEERGNIGGQPETPTEPVGPRKAVRPTNYGIGISQEDIKYDQSAALRGVNSQREIGLEMPEGFGEARFDNRIDNAMNLDNGLEDFRAREQSAFNKIVSGTAKMGVTAATTFADSIFGTIAGLGNLAVEAANGNLKADGNGTVAGKALDAFIENPVSKALNDITKGAEDVFKNYYTNDERNRKWYQNIFTANFIGDTLIKNAGFTIGAAYGGKVATTAAAKMFGINGARSAYQGLTAELSKEYKDKSVSQILEMIRNGEITLDNVDVLKQLEKSAKALKKSEIALQMTGAIMAATGEGRIEAINAADELEQELLEKYGDLDAQKEEAKQSKLAELQAENPDWFTLQLEENNTATSVPKDASIKAYVDEQLKQIDDYYNKIQAEIQHQKAKVANAVFGLNLPLLTFGDVYQFGRFMLGDYATDRIAQTSLKNAATSTVKESVEKHGLKNGIKEFVNAGYKDSVKHGTLPSIGRGMKNALVEMSEEMNQSWISSSQEDYGAHKVNEFNYRLTNPDSEYNTRKWIESVYDGFKNSWANTDDWVEGFSGFFMGALGLPGIRFNHNGKKVDVTMQGGVWDALRDDKKDKTDSAAAINIINNRLQSPEFLNLYYGKIGHDAADNAKAQAAAQGDEWAYEKAEEMQMINDIMMFDKAGRLQDLYDLVDYMAGINSNNVDEIKELYASLNVGIDVANMTEGGILSRLNENRKKLKGALERYEKASSEVKKLYGSQYDDNVLSELVWKLSRLDSINSSMDAVYNEAAKIAILSKQISDFKEYNDKYDKKSDEEILAMPEFRDFIESQTSSDKIQIIEILDKIKKSRSERDAYVYEVDKLMEDPGIIQRKIELEAATKKLNEDAMREAIVEQNIKNGNIATLKQMMNENGTVDDAVMNSLVKLNGEGVDSAKQFLNFINAVKFVHSVIDNSTASNDDKTIMHNAWNSVVSSANTMKDILQRREPGDFNIDGMNNSHLVAINDAIDMCVEANNWSSYLDNAVDEGNRAAARNQTFQGDASHKIQKISQVIKLILTPDVNAHDGKGNAVTGIYYITPVKDSNIYDNNGNRISQKIYVKTHIQSKGFVGDMDFGLVDSYKQNNVFHSFKDNVNAFVLNGMDEPWNETSDTFEPTPEPTSEPVQLTDFDPVPEPPASNPPAAPPPAVNNSVASKSRSLSVINVTAKAADVKINDVVGFSIESENGPIYIVDELHERLGELPTSDYEMDRTTGLRELVQYLREEYNSAEKKPNTPFFSRDFKTRVRSKYTGIDNNGQDRPVISIEGIPQDVKDINFLLITGSENDEKYNFTNPNLQKDDLKTSDGFSLNKGTVYMLLPKSTSTGEKFIPVACRKVDVSESSWNAIKDTVIGANINNAINGLINAITTNDIITAKRNLEEWIYFNRSMPKVFFFKNSNGGVDVKAGNVSYGTAHDVDEMINILSTMNCGIDIKASLFNTSAGRNIFYDRFVKMGLLTANVRSFGEVNKFFMDYFDPQTGKFETAETSPRNQVQQMPPQSRPANTGGTASYLQFNTSRGSFHVYFENVLLNDKWLVNASTGESYTWEESVAKFGKEFVNLTYASAYVRQNDISDFSYSSIDGKFLISTPEGEIGFDRKNTKLLDTAGLDILRGQLANRRQPTVVTGHGADAVTDGDIVGGGMYTGSLSDLLGGNNPFGGGTPINAAPVVQKPAPEYIPEPVPEPVPEPIPDDVPVFDTGIFENDDRFGQMLQVSGERRTKANAETERELLEEMKNRRNKISTPVNSLYGAFKKVNGKTFKGMGSEKNIRKALKNLVPDEVIDFLIEGIKQNPTMKDMSPYDAFVSLINAYSYDIADTYNEGVRKPAIKELDSFLQNFFSKYNIKVEYADLKSRFGNDVPAMFDVLSKTVYLAQGGSINQMTMPEEFAHAFVELMGSVVSRKPENADFTFLMNTVEQTKIFKDVFSTYKDVYTKDGKPDMYKIKKEAIGQALAVALVHNWEMKSETEQEKTFWDKLRELFEKVIQMFKNTEYVSFQNQVDKIAREILAGDTSRLRKVDDTGYRLLDYVETIENQNKMDGGKALGFMRYFNSIGNLITGSIAYRREGTVYRGKLDSLHDIDMVVPKSAHKINIDKIYDMNLDMDQVNLFGYLMDQPYFKKIKSDYPKCRFCAAYAAKREKWFTVNAVYSENEELSERFAGYAGSYAERLDRFTEEERRQIYLFDFFIKNVDDVAAHDDIYGLDMVNSDLPRAEKMYMGRAKDIFDYQMWKDFNDLNDREFSDSNFLMMQKQRIANQKLDEVLEKSRNIYTEPESSYDITDDDIQYLQERGWTKNDWNRISEREKERALDCVRA